MTDPTDQTDQAGGKRAAGYVYVYESATDTQALLFGRCGTDRSNIRYRMTRNQGREANDQLGFLVQGDFSPFLESGAFSDLGLRPLTLGGTVNAQPFSVHFEPDPTTPGNALFRTSAGWNGVVIQTQSSTWEIVVVIGILALAAVAIVAMESDTVLEAKVEVTTPVGGGSTTINVGGRPPEGD